MAAAVAGVSGSTSAALISFASDTNPTAPTLVGVYDPGSNTTGVTDVGPTPVQLLFDPDDDGPLGPYPMEANLDAEMTLTYVGSVQVVPGMFTHTFSVTGFFDFTNKAGEHPFHIRGEFGAGEAAFIGFGSSSALMSASITGFDINYSVVDISPAIYGVSLSELPGDFGFTLTNLNGGLGVALARSREGNVVGVQNFNAESSFSGSFLIPTPGAMALTALSGLVAIRRKRVTATT